MYRELLKVVENNVSITDSEDEFFCGIISIME